MCFSQRNKPACIVAMFSAIVFILACIMLALSIKFTGADVFKAMKDEDGEIDKLKNITFFILASFSGIALMLGICGLCQLKCKRRCCSVIFGVCLLPTWVITFIFGCIIAWFSNSSPSTIQ